MFSSNKANKWIAQKGKRSQVQGKPVAGFQTTSSSTMDSVQGTLNATSRDAVKGRRDKHLREFTADT